jgi:hypothetical protein
MEIVVYARYGRYAYEIKGYKRKLMAESIDRKCSQYIITFSQSGFDRLDDFMNRISRQGTHIMPYSFHIIEPNKWFESRIIVRGNNCLDFVFDILKEEIIIHGNYFEL